MDAPRPESGPRAIEHDLFCLECGYNLRGLHGDPVRCPECGYDNPVGLLEVLAARITEHLRRMETSLVTCVASMLVAAPTTAMLVVIAAQPQRGPPFAEGAF
jgi:hypothetical protein